MKVQIIKLTIPVLLFFFVAIDYGSMILWAQDYDATRKKLLELFMKWDTNRDEKLDENEWHGRAPFEKVDKNGDNTVTKDELGLRTQVAASPAREQDLWNRILKAWDTDGDGKLNKGEWRGKVPFEQLDKNSDGAVTSDEMISEAKPISKESPVSEIPSSHESRDANNDDFQLMLKAMDMDRDGRVSESEWNGSPDMFDHFDQNNDNFITANEVE